MQMKFGKWTIEDNRIKWNGEPLQFFEIPKDAITQTRYDVKGSFFYDWILKATDESFLTQDDLYDLNFAFVYAAAIWKAEFDYHTFDATLEEQYELLDEEEDDWE